MRWPNFLLLLIAVVVLQVSIGPRLALFGQAPDWLLVLVVVHALNSRFREAVLAGWCAGALADIMTIERFGLLALSYALVAALVSAVREQVFVRHPLTRLSAVLICGVILQTLWLVYRAAAGMPSGWVSGFFVQPVYSAAWALLLAVLFERVGGITSRRSKPVWRQQRV